MVDRRGFLRLLGLGTASLVAGAELDLERLLWVPRPMVTVPAMGEGGPWLVSPDWLTREVLKTLENKLTFTKNVNDFYDAAFLEGPAGVPLPIRIRTPGRWYSP